MANRSLLSLLAVMPVLVCGVASDQLAVGKEECLLASVGAADAGGDNDVERGRGIPGRARQRHETVASQDREGGCPAVSLRAAGADAVRVILEVA